MNCFSHCLTFFLALVTIASFGADLYVNYKYSTKDFKNITNSHLTQITPASWAFMIWNVIYGLLIIWFIYVFYLLLRQLCSRSNKSPLFPGIFWFLFIIVNILNAVWIYSFFHSSMIVAGIILAVLTLVLYLLNMIAFRVCWFDVYCNENNSSPYKNDVESDVDLVELSHCELMLLKLLTLNGLPLYAMWCTIATGVQWSMIFKYNLFHWSDSVSSIVPLSILSVLLFMYWHAEHHYKRLYLSCTWLPYLALIVAFSGMISRYHSMGGMHRPGLLFAFILLIITIINYFIKLFTTCMCPSKVENPRFSRV